MLYIIADSSLELLSILVITSRDTSGVSIKVYFVTYNGLSPTSTITNCVSSAVLKLFSINGSAKTKQSKYLETHVNIGQYLLLLIIPLHKLNLGLIVIPSSISNIFYKFYTFSYCKLKYHNKYHILSEFFFQITPLIVYSCIVYQPNLSLYLFKQIFNICPR